MTVAVTMTKKRRRAGADGAIEDVTQIKLMAWNSFDPSMMGGGGWKNHGPAFVITRRVVSVCMAFGVVSELCL